MVKVLIEITAIVSVIDGNDIDDNYDVIMT